MNITELYRQRVLRRLVRDQNGRRIQRMAAAVASLEPKGVGKPVAFFKASSGIDDLSWNSAFHLLASWGLRLSGTPVVYFACDHGMDHCVLGTVRTDVRRAMPCASCVRQSRTLYHPVSTDSATHAQANWFAYEADLALNSRLERMGLSELMRLEWPAGQLVLGAGAIPLGAMCLPSIRWILRRHHLIDSPETRYLLSAYIRSAWNVAKQFAAFLDREDPRVVVVFNGQFFPEAVASWLARARGIRVVTHEVGLQPASAYFTDGEATAYPIKIPADLTLTPAQNARLDAYLTQRFRGDFSMAGIRFWPEMKQIDAGLQAKIRGFQQLVPIFTNVIFDTSQPHANTVFPDMFAWLDMVRDEIIAQPETLFIIRAHPDETRTRKESRETVQDWFEASGLGGAANVVFIGPKESASSYDLIERAKFVLIYNSTIGLEASIMGKPVLSGGKARFTQYPTVFFPPTWDEQRAMLRQFLLADKIRLPAEFAIQARRFLYFQLFRTSLPFDEFLEPSVRTTQAKLKTFAPDALLRSPAIRTIIDGLVSGGSFLLPDGED